MPTFKMNRPITIVSLKGASIHFEKDKPTFAPAFMRAEIEDKGGELVAEDDEGEGVETIAPEPKGKDRVAALNGVFEKLTLAGKLDGTKPPSVKDIQNELGWAPSADERDKAYDAFKKG